MAFIIKNNTGTAFNNDRKTEDKHPDYRGSVKVNNVEYWMAVWFKTAGPDSQIAGKEFMSIAFSPKDNKEYDKSQFRGAAFENELISPGEPDFTGPATIDGKEYQMNVRMKEAGPNAKNPGLEYYSFTFESMIAVKEDESSNQSRQQSTFGGDFDDDIPFN